MTVNTYRNTLELQFLSKIILTTDQSLELYQSYLTNFLILAP